MTYSYKAETVYFTCLCRTKVIRKKNIPNENPNKALVDANITMSYEIYLYAYDIYISNRKCGKSNRVSLP